MSRYTFTQAQRRRGGLTTANLTGPRACPRCGRKFIRHVAFAGHLGLHTFADRYTGGDMRQAAQMFNLLGIAAGDPFPQNGAFAKAHQAAAEVREWSAS